MVTLKAGSHIYKFSTLVLFERSSYQVFKRDNKLIFIKQSMFYFLCRLRSIAAHRDHFVRRLSVCASVCPIVTLF